MADAGSRPARSSSSKARLLGLAVFCAASVLGLGTAGPTVAERERASEREGLDRSLDDPQVKRIRDNPQRRQAFCAVFDWVALRKEYVGSPPPSPCAS